MTLDPVSNRISVFPVPPVPPVMPVERRAAGKAGVEEAAMRTPPGTPGSYGRSQGFGTLLDVRV
ncbi:MAG: hypothetical protein ABI655_05345 [Phenylobacterium sp.]